MTHLILDIGNTHAKAAIVKEHCTIEMVSANDAESLGIESLCRRYNPSKAIASVVGRMPDFHSLLPTDLASRFHLLSCHSLLPIAIDYDTPQTLGMDRVAAAVGARSLAHEGALLVADAGTCITIDLLDADNVYRGGAILPGIEMRLKALNHYTASLPLVELSQEELDGSEPLSYTGKNTRQSIVAGVCCAAVTEMQGFMDYYKSIYGDIKLFLTGGNAVFFAKRLFFPTFAVRDLVLLGLDKILEMNVDD